jgi:hypothetical protein
MQLVGTPPKLLDDSGEQVSASHAFLYTTGVGCGAGVLEGAGTRDESELCLSLPLRSPKKLFITSPLLVGPVLSGLTVKHRLTALSPLNASHPLAISPFGTLVKLCPPVDVETPGVSLRRPPGTKEGVDNGQVVLPDKVVIIVY